ncbi:hypothetical protein V8H18_10480 [Lautropia mirabilis]
MDLSTIGFRPMTEADLPAVDVIEQAVQPYPWRISQFADSLKAGHQAWIFTEAGQPFGYAVLLAALDEVELLTLARRAAIRGAGWDGIVWAGCRHRYGSRADAACFWRWPPPMRQRWGSISAWASRRWDGVATTIAPPTVATTTPG